MPTLLQSKTAIARMLLTLLLGLGHGTVDALVETPTFVETSLSAHLTALLISSEVPLSAASPSLSSILRFQLSLAELPLRDKDAHAPIPLTQSPRGLSLFVHATELTTEFVETSNSILILASALPMQPTAHAVFPSPSSRPRSPARLAKLRATAQSPSTATAAS